MKRMRDEWGSITYDPKRKVGRIRYWAETKDGYRRISKTVRGTRRDVEQERARLMLEHSNDAPCPTVEMAWKTWVLPELEERVAMKDAATESKRSMRGLSKQTKTLYESAWRNHVQPRFGNVPCDQVRPLEVQQWITSMSYGAADMAVTLLKMILDKAMLYEAIQSNPMRNKYLMPAKGAKADDGIWNREEMGCVINAVWDSWCAPAIMLMGLGSCRVGEALGPYASEVSEREVHGVKMAVIPIARQVSNSRKLDDSLKNRWSYRSVVIPGRCGERLIEIASSKDEYSFLTDNGFGDYQTQQTTRKQFVSDLRSAGVPIHPMRNLRNSWQTMMRWDVGLPPWITERMMGHVGEGVTGRHYDRPEVDEFCEVIAEAYRKKPFDRDWNLPD